MSDTQLVSFLPVSEHQATVLLAAHEGGRLQATKLDAAHAADGTPGPVRPWK
jgi:hypothetical protein